MVLEKVYGYSRPHTKGIIYYAMEHRQSVISTFHVVWCPRDTLSQVENIPLPFRCGEISEKAYPSHDPTQLSRVKILFKCVVNPELAPLQALWLGWERYLISNTLSVGEDVSCQARKLLKDMSEESYRSTHCCTHAGICRERQRSTSHVLLVITTSKLGMLITHNTGRITPFITGYVVRP